MLSCSCRGGYCDNRRPEGRRKKEKAVVGSSALTGAPTVTGSQPATGSQTVTRARVARVRGKWTQRLRWLNTMLWGGAALLCLEHIWHGEIVPWPPFLTAVETAGAVGPMLREIATLGLTMTAVILAAWGVMVGMAEMVERRARAAALQAVDSSEIGAEDVGGGA